MRLALAGGGTGGHVVPGLAVVEELARRGELEGVLWLGSGRRAEERALAGLPAAAGGASSRTVALSIERAGGGAPGKLSLAARLPAATWRARRALLQSRSELCLALGGFPCLPSALAARSLNLPLALLEVNAVAGRATRWLAPLAQQVMHAWEPSMPRRGGGRHVLVGPPLGDALLRAGTAEASGACTRRGLDPDAPLLVVLGGSQGAGALNDFMQAALPSLLSGGLQVLHQVGPGRLAQAAAPAPGYVAEEYLQDVPAALAAATLVLCRGGAATLCELGALHRPALVVPYPHHSDRQQERNALELGAGVRLLPQEGLDATVATEIVRLASAAGAEERAEMAAVLAERVPREGAIRVADLLNELLGSRGARA